MQHILLEGCGLGFDPDPDQVWVGFPMFEYVSAGSRTRVAIRGLVFTVVVVGLIRQLGHVARTKSS